MAERSTHSRVSSRCDNDAPSNNAEEKEMKFAAVMGLLAGFALAFGSAASADPYHYHHGYYYHHHYYHAHSGSYLGPNRAKMVREPGN
jgi:hypothetical protein